MPLIEDPAGSGQYVVSEGAVSAVPWATVADVLSLTGRTVTELHRVTAAGVIETVTGLIESVERTDLSNRDRHWLRMAVVYQAAWVAENPDLFSRVDVTSASQDGESASFRNVDAHLLAPLARKAIRRLSWRALTRPGDAAPLRAGRLPITSEAADDALPWRRM